MLAFEGRRYGVDEDRTAGVTFQDFYRAHEDRVRRVAARQVGAANADDVVQEVMLRAFREYGRLDHSRPIWPWLATVTRNVSVDTLRRTRHTEPTDAETIEALLPPEPDGPADTAVVADLRSRVHRGLRRLGDHDRRLIEMRELDGLGIEEIAPLLGATAGAVRQRLYRARQALRVELDKVGARSGLSQPWLSQRVDSRPRLRDLYVRAVDAVVHPIISHDSPWTALIVATALLAGAGAAAAASGTPEPSGVPVTARPAQLPLPAGVELPAMPRPSRLASQLLSPLDRVNTVCARLTGPVAAGQWHSLAVASDGAVWAWGFNGDGQLGDGTNVHRRTPTRVSGLSRARAVATGSFHSLAVTADGALWAWGNNDNGQLGDGTTVNRHGPTRVPGLSGVRAVAASASHSLAVTADGALWAWGDNIHGQLGNGTTIDRRRPTRVADLSGARAVAAGGSHSLAVTADGALWSWGMHGDGMTPPEYLPTRVAGLPGARAVAAGASHSLAVTADGALWAWGYNDNGQLGDGTTVARSAPARVSGLSGVRVVSAGGSHSLAVTSDGRAFAWGLNDKGQLGHPEAAARSAPVRVPSLSGVRAVAAGASHSLAVTDDGAFASGDNGDGRLGDGTTISRATPSGIGCGRRGLPLPNPPPLIVSVTDTVPFELTLDQATLSRRSIVFAVRRGKLTVHALAAARSAETPANACVTIAPAVQPNCTRPGLDGNTLYFENAAYDAVGPAVSLQVPGGMSTGYTWKDSTSSGWEGVACTWKPTVSLGLVTVAGSCTVRHNVPSGPWSGAVFGSQASCNRCATPPQHGVFTHLAYTA